MRLFRSDSCGRIVVARCNVRDQAIPNYRGVVAVS